VSLPREKFGTSLSPNRLAYATADWPRPPCVRAASPHHRKLGAGYAALPQWLDGVSDVILDPLWRSRTTGIQNDRRLPGTTGPRVRSPWLAAMESFDFVVCEVFLLEPFFYSSRKLNFIYCDMTPVLVTKHLK